MHHSGISLSDGLAAAALVVAILSAAGTVWASVVAHKALNYEKKKDKDAKTAVVEFKFEYKAGPARGVLITNEDYRYRYWLVVSVINAGETTETLGSVKVRSVDPHNGGESIGIIEVSKDFAPHTSIPAWVDMTTLLKFPGGYIAEAQLGRGGPFISDPVQIDATVVGQVREKTGAA